MGSGPTWMLKQLFCRKKTPLTSSFLPPGIQHKERGHKGSAGQCNQAADRHPGDEGEAGEHGLQADSHEAVCMWGGDGRRCRRIRSVISALNTLFLIPHLLAGSLPLLALSSWPPVISCAAWALKGFPLRKQLDGGRRGRTFWTPSEPVRDCSPVIPNAV